MIDEIRNIHPAFQAARCSVTGSTGRRRRRLEQHRSELSEKRKVEKEQYGILGINSEIGDTEKRLASAREEESSALLEVISDRTIQTIIYSTKTNN